MRVVSKDANPVSTKHALNQDWKASVVHSDLLWNASIEDATNLRNHVEEISNGKTLHLHTAQPLASPLSMQSSIGEDPRRHFLESSFCTVDLNSYCSASTRALSTIKHVH